MSTLTCQDCGFDGSQWSDDDLDRTLAHADDLIGYVLEGVDGSSITGASWARTGFDTDPTIVTHELVHHLDELARLRRVADEFEPLVRVGAPRRHGRSGRPGRDRRLTRVAPR